MKKPSLEYTKEGLVLQKAAHSIKEAVISEVKMLPR